jgi:hypothetical protein
MVGRLCVLFVALRVLSFGQRGTVQGQVVDPTQAVIPHAKVVLGMKGGASTLQTTNTDFNGYFKFTGVAPGVYEIIVSRQGFADHAESVNVEEGKDTEVPAILLALGPIPGCADYRLELPTIRFESLGASETQLDGSIAALTGEQLRAVTVSLRRIGHHNNPLTTSTDGNNQFSFRGTEPGTYALRAARPGYSDFVIDRVEIKLGQRSNISEPLEMDRCPAGVRCKPNHRIRVPELCL